MEIELLMDAALKYRPELWGGIECTINRIGNRFRDQLEYTGHYDRPGDLEKFAALGIKKIRYPVLWERHQPAEEIPVNWSWTGRQLLKIKELGMEPVAGLLHHGSGPVFTSLDDPQFAGRFAAYAGKVARRFPWINYYTLVNEPLTTARFAGLYGFWYPHQQSDRSFCRMLINQLKATVLGMQQVHAVNPGAQLVQTEDLAYVHSTQLLHYQAAFENNRRWLTWDILTGRMNEQHPLWQFFIDAGISPEELYFFSGNPCVPGIIGCNYYITSERYLDEQVEHYPPHTHGYNTLHHYADVEAVHVAGMKGIEQLLLETWERYGLPLAVTECHIHCSREEQMRWFNQVYEAACSVATKGALIESVTAWSLLGAYDWNSLLTKEANHYETGVFDSTGNELRPTALAKMIRTIAGQDDYKHPVLAQRGWWDKELPVKKEQSPVLLIGKNGTLATAFQRIADQRRLPMVALGRDAFTNGFRLEQYLDEHRPWAVINASGFVRVDDAETEQQECFRVNTLLPELLACQCARHGLPLVTFSSDLVFDGNKSSPYTESDIPRSLNVYGTTKYQGELRVKKANPGTLIIRSSSFFGPWDVFNFVHQACASLKAGTIFKAATDILISPTYVPDLVNRVLDLLIDEETGTWHVVNRGAFSWYELAREIAERMGKKANSIMGTPASEMEWKAKRPAYSVLDSEKAMGLPAVEDALARYFVETRA